MKWKYYILQKENGHKVTDEFGKKPLIFHTTALAKEHLEFLGNNDFKVCGISVDFSKKT